MDAKEIARELLPPIAVRALRAARRLRGGPGPTLRDGDLTLTPLTLADRWMVEQAAADPEIARRFDALARSGDYFNGWLEEQGGAFVIGSLGRSRGLLTFEQDGGGRLNVSFWLFESARGRGLAVRALRLASEWALRQPGVERLQMWTAPDNVASQRVAVRAGFRMEGTLRSYQEINGRREDAVVFSLLAGEEGEGSNG